MNNPNHVNHISQAVSQAAARPYKPFPGRDAIIICRPRKRTKALEYIEFALKSAITLMMWCFLAYAVYYHFFQLGWRVRVLPTGEVMVAFCAFVVVWLGGWQLYNWLLFHGKDRRKSFPMQPDAEIAKLYNIREKDVAAFRETKRLGLVSCENGRYIFHSDNGTSFELGLLRAC